MLYDITRPLTPRTAGFPGDTPVSITRVADMDAGASCNVSALTLSSHAATHVDAPLHYSPAAHGIDRVPLETLLGPCRVVSFDGAGDISRAALQALLATPLPQRVLLHTRASAVADDVWEADFAAFEADAADWLGANGARLIGTDAPSVDSAISKTLPAHNAFLRHGVVIIENLQLTGVPDGDYELIALPLRIAGADAAPARVLLRT